LHRRNGISIRIVGVGRDRQAGECQVVRVCHDTYIEHAAVVGLANVAEALRNLEHGPGLTGHVVEQDEPEPQDRFQAGRAAAWILEIGGPVVLWKPTREVCRAP